MKVQFQHFSVIWGDATLVIPATIISQMTSKNKFFFFKWT